MSQNLAATHFNDEQWTAVDQAIAALEQALSPLLVSIGADDRKRLVKMGDASEAFCRKALDVMAENSGVLPRNLDVEEIRRIERAVFCLSGQSRIRKGHRREREVAARVCFTGQK